MKLKNRIYGMIVALILIVVSYIGVAVFHNDGFIIIFGVAAGWALRETLEPKPEDEEK